MRCEYVVQGEDQTLYVPYGTGTSRSNGSDGRNNGFINLEREPERIDEIHELNGYPELKQCIEIMLKTPIFRSLRVDTCMDQNIRPKFRNSCYSMITFVFRHATPSDGFEFRSFFEDFKQHEKLSDRVFVYFIENPVKTGDFKGVCLDIRVIANGYSPADARGQWKAAMRKVNASVERWQNTIIEQGGGLPETSQSPGQ